MAEFDSDADIFDRTRGGPYSKRGSKALEPQLHEREQGARTSEPCENCITSGSPLYRGLTKATHPLHGASETEASQSGNEPEMQRAIRTALLTAIRNLSLYYYKVDVEFKSLLVRVITEYR